MKNILSCMIITGASLFGIFVCLKKIEPMFNLPSSCSNSSEDEVRNLVSLIVILAAILLIAKIH